MSILGGNVSAPTGTAPDWGVAEEVLRLFAGLGVSIKEDVTRSAESLGLSAPMFHALMSMGGTPCSQRELAGTLHYDASNVTGIVDRLVERGLVERQVDPKDRRIRLVVITEAGIELRKQLIQLVLTNGRTLVGLTDDEQLQLRDLLRKIATPVDLE
jgi:DNA-binding MarR family transcriptional regulator